MSKRPGVPYAKGRKFCIFCGAPADSEEHIWPKWAKDILPSLPSHRRFVLDGRRSTGKANVRKEYARQGPHSTIRIKRVCKRCNSDWMGTYEERVRPYLEPMIKGEPALLTADAKQTLAEYLTYKIMVADWLDDNHPALPSACAHDFFRSRTIPQLTRIWLFRCAAGGWQSAIHSEGHYFDRDEDFVPESPLNTKSFAVGFGDLFVFAVVSTKVDLNINFDGPGVLQLWPPAPVLFMWPPRVPITSDEAKFVATTLQRLAGGSNVDITGFTPV